MHAQLNNKTKINILSKAKEKKEELEKESNKNKESANEVNEKTFTFIEIDDDNNENQIVLKESELEDKHHHAMASDLYDRFTSSTNVAKAMFMAHVSHKVKDAEEKVSKMMEGEIIETHSNNYNEGGTREQ